MSMTVLQFVVGLIAALFGLGALVGGDVAFGLASLVVGAALVFGGVRGGRA